MNERNEPAILPGGARWAEFPAVMWRGIGMGIAEVIPGVSGGTIALITGILDRLIAALHSFNAEAVRNLLHLRFGQFFSLVHWRFLVMLFTGQVLGILLCTKVIKLPYLLREYPEPMLGLFFGLILASTVLLARDAGVPRWRGILSYSAGGLIGLIAVVGLGAETPEEPWFIFVCGAAAICAWILPGISGSFVLLLLHKYDYIWEAVTFGNGVGFFHNVFTVIVPFGAGALVGLMLFSHFLAWILNHWRPLTMMAMTGMLFMSLWAIFPFQHATYKVVASGKEKLIRTSPYLPSVDMLGSMRGILAVLLAAAGFSAVLWLDSRAQRRVPPKGDKKSSSR